MRTQRVVLHADAANFHMFAQRQNAHSSENEERAGEVGPRSGTSRCPVCGAVPQWTQAQEFETQESKKAVKSNAYTDWGHRVDAFKAEMDARHAELNRLFPNQAARPLNQ